MARQAVRWQAWPGAGGGWPGEAAGALEGVGGQAADKATRARADVQRLVAKDCGAAGPAHGRGPVHASLRLAAPELRSSGQQRWQPPRRDLPAATDASPTAADSSLLFPLVRIPLLAWTHLSTISF